jgi:hypothetical protein
MKIIFLDIDGVLNHDQTMSITPGGWKGLSINLVSRLGLITKKTGAVVVLTTSWRNDWDKNVENRNPDGEYLYRKLSKEKVFILDKTKDFSEDQRGAYFYRGKEIVDYLQNHPEIESYIVVDDNEFDFADHPEAILPYFIQTDSNVGLSMDNMNQMIQLLSKEKEVEPEIEIAI